MENLDGRVGIVRRIEQLAVGELGERPIRGGDGFRFEKFAIEQQRDGRLGSHRISVAELPERAVEVDKRTGSDSEALGNLVEIAI